MRANCNFSLDRYRELLGAAAAGAYRVASFDDVPRASDHHLRHDVDDGIDSA